MRPAPAVCRGLASPFGGLALLLGSLVLPSAAALAYDEIDLSETPIPFLKSEDLPPRAGALIELGRGINEVGELPHGIEMPTGAVWQPALWIFGSLRGAYLDSDRDPRALPGPSGEIEELAVRMDLFANLQLTGTERVITHIRPLDGTGGFTRQVLGPGEDRRETRTDWSPEVLFFEGDLGEMFPLFDPQDRGEGDLGFAVGKMPVEFQNGYLVRDEMVAVGLSKTNVQVSGSGGVRVLGLWGFDHVNESNGARDRRGVDLLGLFVEGDFPWGLLELDLAATLADESRGKQLNAGVGWTGHSAGHNYSLHVNVSQQTDQTVVRDPDPKKRRNVRPNGQEKDYDGLLAVAGYSTEVSLAHDLVYANVWWAEGDFGRLASNGTPPLGPVGLSFAGVGLGAYRPALWPRPLDSAGGALGVQKFFAAEKANLVLELAHRRDLEDEDEFGDTGGSAATLRFQRKFANRFMVQVDAYRAWYDKGGNSTAARCELRVNF